MALYFLMRAFVLCAFPFVITALVVLSEWALLFRCGGNVSILHYSAYNLPPPNVVWDDALFKYHKKDSNLVLWYFPGNGRGASHVRWHVGELYKICNCSVYVYNPPQCRKSASFWFNPYTKDLDSLLFFHLDYKKENVLYGESLGGTYILQTYWNLRGRHQKMITGFIFENPLTNIPDIMNHYVPWSGVLALNRWNNTKGMTHIHQSVLFITSGEDEIVPKSMSTTLMNACPSITKKQVILPGAKHGHAMSHPLYQETVKSWIKYKR